MEPTFHGNFKFGKAKTKPLMAFFECRFVSQNGLLSIIKLDLMIQKVRFN